MRILLDTKSLIPAKSSQGGARFLFLAPCIAFWNASQPASSLSPKAQNRHVPVQSYRSVAGGDETSHLCVRHRLPPEHIDGPNAALGFRRVGGGVVRRRVGLRLAPLLQRAAQSPLVHGALRVVVVVVIDRAPERVRGAVSPPRRRRQPPPPPPMAPPQTTKRGTC